MDSDVEARSSSDYGTLVWGRKAKGIRMIGGIERGGVLDEIAETCDGWMVVLRDELENLLIDRNKLMGPRR